MAAYIKQKEEREARIEEEKAEIKRLKEEKQLRLLRLQESAQGHQAAQDALRAKRNQEATEREWRRKELEEQVPLRYFKKKKFDFKVLASKRRKRQKDEDCS